MDVASFPDHDLSLKFGHESRISSLSGDASLRPLPLIWAQTRVTDSLHYWNISPHLFPLTYHFLPRSPFSLT